MSLSIQFTAALKRRIEANLVIAGEIVATEVRRNIQTSPRGGKTYTLSKQVPEYEGVVLLDYLTQEEIDSLENNE